MLCGLISNAFVIHANAGIMPVLGMPSRLHVPSPLWQAATSNTRLLFLADQARLGLFSIGDLVLLFGGILVVATYLHRILKYKLFTVPRFRCPARGVLSPMPSPVIAQAQLGSLHYCASRKPRTA